ncbi:MAG: serine hydrolase domain-containing protein [Chloroflexota bacterium]
MNKIDLDTLLYQSVENGDVPGIVAQVVNRSDTLYCGAFGRISDHNSVDMPVDAIFQIKSMTKPITSVAIMILQEEGLLDINDPVERYLPEFKDVKIIAESGDSDIPYLVRPLSRQLTLQHLLTHTAGVSYPFCNRTLNNLGKPLPLPTPILHEPGARWTYGPGTRILGHVIEQVTHEPLDHFLESRIFKPLAMKDTGFHLKPENAPRFVSLHRRVNDVLICEQNPNPYEPQVFGDIGLLTTINDYSRFLQMLLNMGQMDGERILAEDSVIKMTRNQIGALVVEEQPGAVPELANPFPLDAGEDNFGLGFQIRTSAEKGRRSPGSYSWSGLYNTHFWVDPKQEIAALLFIQVLPFYDSRGIQIMLDFERQIYYS